MLLIVQCYDTMCASNETIDIIISVSQHYVIFQAQQNKDHSHAQKTRFLIQDSIKLNCPAEVKLSRHIQYTSHKVTGIPQTFGI